MSKLNPGLIIKHLALARATSVHGRDTEKPIPANVRPNQLSDQPFGVLPIDAAVKSLVWL